MQTLLRAIPHTIAIIAAFLPAHLICCATEPALRLGEPAPPVAVGSWVQGEPITKLDSTKAYLIDFWAIWCGPCVAEVPHLNELYLKFKDKGLVVIGQAVSKQDQEKVKPFVSKMADKMTYRVALDDFSNSERGAMAASWYDAVWLKTLPSAILVGKDGRIGWIGGPRNLKDSLIEDALSGTLDPVKVKAEAMKLQEAAPAGEKATMAFLQCVTEKKWDKADKALTALSKIPDALQSGMLLVFRLMILVGKGDFDGVDALLSQEKLSEDALKAVSGILSDANREAGGKNARILSAFARVARMKGRDANPDSQSSSLPK